MGKPTRKSQKKQESSSSAKMVGEKPLFSVLEDAIAYSGHSEICGCADQFGHAAEWLIQLPPLYEGDVRRLLVGLNALWRQHAEITRAVQTGNLP